MDQSRAYAEVGRRNAVQQRICQRRPGGPDHGGKAEDVSGVGANDVRACARFMRSGAQGRAVVGALVPLAWVPWPG